MNMRVKQTDEVESIFTLFLRNLRTILINHCTYIVERSSRHD